VTEIQAIGDWAGNAEQLTFSLWPQVKRTPLRKVSAKRRATFPARKAAMAEVRARDSNTCQFWLRLVVWAQESGAVYFPNRPNVDGAQLLREARHAFFDKFELIPPECSGPLDGHEPKHRSQGGDPTDPDAIRLVCRAHHSWCHNWPLAGRALGL
jgi:hypothetical protein